MAAHSEHHKSTGDNKGNEPAKSSPKLLFSPVSRVFSDKRSLETVGDD